MYEGLRNLEIPGKHKHPRARRVVKLGLLGLVIMAVLFAGLAFQTYRYVQNKLDSGNIDVEVAAPLPDGPLNILILGSDNREGLTRAEKKKLHISNAGGKRSDTIIVLHISSDKKKAVLVHFPRDLLVKVPGLGGLNRINTAYAFGGAQRAIDTIKNLTGLPLHHYVEVNFASFRNLVNAVGGVSLSIPKGPLKDEQSGLNITETGCVELDGDQALAFVRARKIYPNQDLGRIQAQQRFMRALFSKVKSPGTLANLFKVRNIADAIGDPRSGIKHDKGVDLGLARSIAGALGKFDSSSLDFRVIPSSTRAGSPFVYVNESEARAFFRAMKAGRALPKYGKTGQSVADPEDVAVRVFNGSGKVGQAGREASRLRGLGFLATIGGNAKRIANTRITYDPADAQKATLVAKYFPGADLVARAQNIDVIVTMGPDAVTPGTASSSPKAAAKPKTPQLGQACG